MADSSQGPVSPERYHPGPPHGPDEVPPEGETPAGVRHRVLLAVLRRLPQAAMSRVVGRLSDLPVPSPLRTPLYRALARAMGVDVGEAEKPLKAYRSVNAFFVRRLRPGARSWPSDPAAMASPVDGVVGPVGRVRDGILLQAKGVEYRLDELLASKAEARILGGGFYLTLYLAPRHYHRIHAPGAARIPSARHVPGRLLPVTPWARTGVPDLFPRNERLVASMDGEAGRMALAAVGAFNVGRISAAFDPTWGGRRKAGRGVTNHGVGRELEVRRYDPPVEVARGEELMAFHLGSTVILVWEGGAGAPARGLEPGVEVRVGQPILERTRDEVRDPGR